MWYASGASVGHRRSDASTYTRRSSVVPGGARERTHTSGEDGVHSDGTHSWCICASDIAAYTPTTEYTMKLPPYMRYTDLSTVHSIFFGLWTSMNVAKQSKGGDGLLPVCTHWQLRGGYQM